MVGWAGTFAWADFCLVHCLYNWLVLLRPMDICLVGCTSMGEGTVSLFRWVYPAVSPTISARPLPLRLPRLSPHSFTSLLSHPKSAPFPELSVVLAEAPPSSMSDAPEGGGSSAMRRSLRRYEGATGCPCFSDREEPRRGPAAVVHSDDTASRMQSVHAEETHPADSSNHSATQLLSDSQARFLHTRT